jgi:hypothetical protein
VPCRRRNTRDPLASLLVAVWLLLLFSVIRVCCWCKEREREKTKSNNEKYCIQVDRFLLCDTLVLYSHSQTKLCFPLFVFFFLFIFRQLQCKRRTFYWPHRVYNFFLDILTR